MPFDSRVPNPRLKVFVSHDCAPPGEQVVARAFERSRTHGLMRSVRWSLARSPVSFTRSTPRPVTLITRCSFAAEGLEFVRVSGCTRTQLLWRVKLPFAMPVIMLEFNQTIMFGIAMVVSAAPVGTNSLGQHVYIGRGGGDFGVGIVAGISVAVIAIIADRMTQGVCRAWQERLGLDSR